MLSNKEISRYNRHILLSEIGREGQEKLKSSRVLVIGAGGLGCPVLLYLTAAGVGTIGIIDFDTIEESNLQRQTLFDDADIGQPKAEVAKLKLERKNPYVKIKAYQKQLSVGNALELFSNYDIVIDGTDNFATRYMVNDACFLLKKVLVSGSIFKFEGQVIVFDFRQENSPTYRCLFPSPPSPDQALSCAEIGVMGVLPGIIGALLANEAIKTIVGIGKVLTGRLLVMNTLSMDIQTLDFERNKEAIEAIPLTKAEFKEMDYAYFCGERRANTDIKEISADHLFAKINANERLQIIDVRATNEEPQTPMLNSIKIPLEEILDRADEIETDKNVIVICRSGIRSAKAIDLLQHKLNHKHLFNLQGGVMEWILKVNEIQKV